RGGESIPGRGRFRDHVEQQSPVTVPWRTQWRKWRVEHGMKRALGLALFLALACVPALAPAQVYNYVSLDTIKNSYSAASVLRARDYGVLTTNTAGQNDTAFLTLKTAMQASNTTVWRVIFEPGTYHYTNNRWLFNVQNVICECYGTIFQNDNALAANVDGVTLFVRDMFDDAGDVPGLETLHVN